MIIFGGITDPSSDPFDPSVPGSNSLFVWSTTLRQWSQPAYSDLTNVNGGGAPHPQKFLTSVPLASEFKMLSVVSNSSTGTTQGNLLGLDVNSWTWSVPTAPNPDVAPPSRLGAAVGMTDNSILIHGGTAASLSGYATSTSVLNDLTKLDGSTLEWKSIANGPALMHHTMCKLTGLNKMVIFGGSDSASNAFNTVHTLDLEQETWTLAVPVNPGIGGSIPSIRKGHSATCLNNTMIVFGGGAAGPSDDDVWVLDASSSPWVWNRMTTNKQVGPGPRTGHSALLNSTNVLIWGGHGAPIAGDTHIYILDTIGWKWSSSRDPGPNSFAPVTPEGGGSVPDSKNNVPLTIGVVCGSLALIGAFAAYLILRRRASRRNEKQTKGSQDNASYMSDAEQHLSGDVHLDDKPTYYNYHAGRDSGSSLGGWPSIAAKRSIPQPSQEYAMQSLTPKSQQDGAALEPAAERDVNQSESSKAQNLRRPAMSMQQPALGPPRDAEKSSQHTGTRAESIASNSYYPAHLAENDEEDADRWTFASSLSFDQREKHGGPLPTLRYIPSKTSGSMGLQRSMAQSTGNLAPGLAASRAARRDGSAPSILSGRGSSTSPASISLSAAGGTQGQRHEGSMSPRDATLFNSVSPLDRVSLMCSGLDVDSRTSADEDGLTGGYLSPTRKYPQWRGSYRESFAEEGVKEEEEEEKHFTLQRTGSNSTGNSSTAYSTLDHPAMIMLIQNLPARYIVSKSPRPIHGRWNDVIFAVDSDTQQPIVVKSFARREAWERECRTLRRLRGPCVVELKHVATLVLSETDEPDKPAKIRLTILERLDETLAQMLKNARKARKLALREQAASVRESDVAADAESLDLAGAGLYRPGPVVEQGYIKDIVKGVLRCLAWCHSKKIVFCDLKPTNIMRNRDDPRQQWKLIDLEASRVAAEECTSVGTVRYCPPEVAKGTGSSKESAFTANVTAQSSMDLWAFGCLLYELYATRPLIPMSESDTVVLHFLANPSPDTPALSNGLRWKNAVDLEIPYFEEAVQDKHARTLIRILLHPDPRLRATMTQVLDSDFLNTGTQGRSATIGEP
ncbi:Negative regulator of mitotic exit [Mortierella alpina]|uniref:Negative regulator of mitotic exit n=1 Tax=Mortierella alpina TaxID=64518 RepID=A0A9P6J7T5_MORAP|nr:Negative regulator of mitotic exit [Mortierella alpina]